MLALLIRKELLDHLLSLRFAMACIICPVVILSSVFVLARDYRDASQDYHTSRVMHGDQLEEVVEQQRDELLGAVVPDDRDGDASLRRRLDGLLERPSDVGLLAAFQLGPEHGAVEVGHLLTAAGLQSTSHLGVGHGLAEAMHHGALEAGSLSSRGGSAHVRPRWQ